MCEEYMLEESPIASFLAGFSLDEKGFIVHNETSNEEYDFEELPDHYIIIINSTKRTKQADRYQLEYVFKMLLSEDEKFEKIEITATGSNHLYFYGRPFKVDLLYNKLNKDKFEITDLVNNFKL